MKINKNDVTSSLAMIFTSFDMIISGENSDRNSYRKKSEFHLVSRSKKNVKLRSKLVLDQKESWNEGQNEENKR